MKVPETTSADAIDAYTVGTRVLATGGPAWQDVRLSVFALPPTADIFTMPAVPEPLIVWTTSGEAETQEREGEGSWLTTRVRKGSFFLTSAGAPYDFRYRTLTPEPFEIVLVLLSLPLFAEGMRDVFGAQADLASLRDISGFEDPQLIPLLQILRDEAIRPSPSPLFVRGIGLAIAVHIARNYGVLTDDARGEVSALPAFKLRRITAWMREHMADEFRLAPLAEMAGLSEFHFNRMFRRATGVPPSQYQIQLRMDAARRLLRETKKSVITIANDVGYSNPSHFAQTFRRRTGLSPSDYRRQR